MSAPKHTPGPWVEDGRTGSIWQSGGPVNRATDLRIAVVDISDERDPEDRANARLIAAAPELLEALKKVLRDARFVGTDLSALRLANEAIAKATGGGQ